MLTTKQKKNAYFELIKDLMEYKTKYETDKNDKIEQLKLGVIEELIENLKYRYDKEDYKDRYGIKY